MKSKIEYIVMLVSEFAKRYRMSSQEALNYLLRYKGVDLCDAHYNVMHTLSLKAN